MDDGEARPEDLNAAIMASQSLLSNAEFLKTLKLQMHRFATLQLSDADLAEDAVQEALVGALKNARSFGARAAWKTWVFTILKHKIADILRQKQRMTEVNRLMREDEEHSDFSGLFNRGGRWQPDSRPQKWGHPEAALQESQFWRVFEICLDDLPGKQARVFMMREFVGLDSDEICVAVGITLSNLHVMLHRARMRLRICLEKRWFTEGERSC